MSTLEVSPADSLSGQSIPSKVNDFSLQVATVNGSGSQTANTVLMRAIFQMVSRVREEYVPVEYRGPAHLVHHPRQQEGLRWPAQGSGFPGGHEPETAREDVLKLESGAAVVYDEPLEARRAAHRPAPLSGPLRKLVGPVCPEAKLRKLVRNMIYDGVAARVLSIEMDEVHKAGSKSLASARPRPPSSIGTRRWPGSSSAAKTFTKADPFRVERLNATAGMRRLVALFHWFGLVHGWFAAVLFALQ